MLYTNNTTKQSLAGTGRKCQLKRGYMQKLWTLCQAMGDKATTLLCKMHGKYTDKMPLLHSWPIQSKAFKNMAKYAQFNVLNSFFNMFLALQVEKKEEIRALREEFDEEGDASDDAEKNLKKEIARVRKSKDMSKTSMLLISHFHGLAFRVYELGLGF